MCCSCTDFAADLGHVVLEAAANATAVAASAPPPSAPALSNCVPLTGKYYAHWEV